MAEGIKPLMRGAEEEAMKSNCWFVQVQDSGWCWAGGMSRTQAEAEKAMAACKAHNIACGITALTRDEADRRLREGWRMIRTERRQ